MVFYVGTYTRLGGPGIAICSLDHQGLHVHHSVMIGDPTYLLPSLDGRQLFAISSDPAEGMPGGSYASFTIDGKELALRNQYSVGAPGPCHLCFSPDGRFLYTANYRSGTLSVLPLDPPGPLIQLVRHSGSSINRDRQESAHIHHVSFIPGTNCLVVADLGLDALVHYQQDPNSGLLTESGRSAMAPGSGPRHLVHGSSGMAYLAHELSSSVSVLASADGHFTEAQTLSTLPPGWDGDNTAAAIRTDGNHVFVSNRGHDSLAVFQIQPDGLLRNVGIFPSGGRTPRDFQVLPDGRILVAHQGGSVNVMQWDRISVRVTDSGLTLALAGAVCIALPQKDFVN